MYVVKSARIMSAMYACYMSDPDRIALRGKLLPVIDGLPPPAATNIVHCFPDAFPMLSLYCLHVWHWLALQDRDGILLAGTAVHVCSPLYHGQLW